MTPILSICIPTYNRSGYLYFTLKSITTQDIFKNTNQVEIVISDNNSSDLTEKIARLFVEKFPDKIIYSKNTENIGDLNFEKVLQIANGEVLKLHNDNFVFVEGALEKIINVVKENQDEKPMIFFTNGNSRVKQSKLCTNLNEFIEAASYLTTWIGAFSIWKQDFKNFEDFSKNVHTQLMQTDVLFRTITSGKNIFVDNQHIFDGQDVLKKGGYNISKIFGKNYLSLLKPYLETNHIDKKHYEHEKKVLLLNHIIPMKFSCSRRERGWNFKNDGYWRHLLNDYWYNLYFYTSVIEIFKLLLNAELNLIYRKLYKNSYQKYWRKRNKHNQTTIDKKVDASKTFVGKGVTGNIVANFTGNPNELLIIDDNATIADNIEFNFNKNELVLIK